MKTPNCRKCLISILFVGLIILMGCRPGVRDLIKVIAPVPLGASRDEIRKVLVEAYGKKFPKLKREYALIEGPYPLYPGMIKADTDLLALFNREGHFTDVYPSDLFDKMPSGAFLERIGLVAEASEEDGQFEIFYDSKTNYIGYFAYSTARAR